MSTVLLPWSPLDERSVDEEFRPEHAALAGSGVRRALVDQDRLESDHVVSARGLEPGDTVLYRGWMLRPEAYDALDAGLRERGCTPVVTPAQYRAAHLAPGWLHLFADVTPRSVVVPHTAAPDAITAAARSLGAASFVVKDFVKSRKHEWDTACFAPDADALPGVVAAFLDLQGDSLVGDLVIRAYEELDGSTPEARVWWVRGEPALVTSHPDAHGEVAVSPAILERLAPGVARLGSPFVTTDVAHRADGSEVMIELGDGQVSGLPAGLPGEEVAALLARVLVA